MVDPNEVYEAIVSQLTNNRTKKSLEAIHEVCKEQDSAGASDFRIVTISKLGAKRGVPSAQTIRNKTGEQYRALIEAWQVVGEKKEKENKRNTVPSAKYDWVNKVEDPTLRYLVLDLVAQVRHLNAENKALVSVKKLEIDYRSGSTEVKEKVLPDFLSHELDSLKAAIDDNFLKRQGWEKGERGCVKDANGKMVFKNGWVDVIEKILSVNSS
tara:strand:+ start:33338 stop:33973 length:636 start_codon:yes stop_codon:yes gene_type:complete